MGWGFGQLINSTSADCLRIWIAVNNCCCIEPATAGLQLDIDSEVRTSFRFALPSNLVLPKNVAVCSYRGGDVTVKGKARCGPTLCFKKNRTPITGWRNFVKIGPLWVIFLHIVLAFNCGLIAFEKLDMRRVPHVQFPWQQEHHIRWQLFVKGQCDPQHMFDSRVPAQRTARFHSTGVVVTIAVQNLGLHAEANMRPGCTEAAIG